LTEQGACRCQHRYWRPPQAGGVSTAIFTDHLLPPLTFFGWLLCQVDKVGSSLTLSSPLGLLTSSKSLSSLLPPHPLRRRSGGQRPMKKEEGLVAITFALSQNHCHGVRGRAEQARRGFSLLLSIFWCWGCYFATTATVTKKQQLLIVNVRTIK
jgi:hypothetical protein